MSNDIGGFFSGAIQSLDQNIEGSVEGMFKSNSSGTSAAGQVQGGNSLGGFDIGALFNMGSNGIMGELFAKIGGNELGIIGNLFQGNTNKSQQGNGWSPPPAGNGGTYVPPPPPGNTGTGTSVGPCGTLPHRDGPDGTAGSQSTGGAQVAGSNGTSSVAGTADPRLPDAIAALETLMMNFGKCSTNGQVTKGSIEQAAWDPSNPALQQAAKFFTSNPDLMRQLFTYSGGSSASIDQLNTIDKIWTSVEKTNGPGATTTTANLSTGTTATPATTASGNTGIGSGSSALIADLQRQIAQLQQQLNTNASGGSASWESPPSINPNMTTGGDALTVAAKKTSTDSDSFSGAIKGVQDKIAVLQQDAKDNPKNADADFEQIKQLDAQVQMLMNIEQEEFQMMSEMLKDFHDMSMTAIRNING